MTTPLILVTGGTGTLGRPIVSALLEAGVPVRVLTRRLPSDPQVGAEHMVGDYRAGTGAFGHL